MPLLAPVGQTGEVSFEPHSPKKGSTIPMSVKSSEKPMNADWPYDFPMPSDDDIEFLDTMSKRNTGSSFFEKKKTE